MRRDDWLLRADGGGWRFEVDEADLTLIGVNHRTRLQFGRAEVVIEAPFDLVVGDTRYTLDPGKRSGLGPLLTVYPDTLTDAVATPDGALHLAFRSGTTIIVNPDPHYEAWSLVGGAGSLVVCTPGGEVAVWRAPGSQSRQ